MDIEPKGFQHGDVLPGGVEALEVGVMCPEETAFLVPVGEDVLAIGDAMIRYSELGFVPDHLMGDDPEAIVWYHTSHTVLLQLYIDQMVEWVKGNL